jgi:hypothetical protein
VALQALRAVCRSTADMFRLVMDGIMLAAGVSLLLSAATS